MRNEAENNAERLRELERNLVSSNVLDNDDFESYLRENWKRIIAMAVIVVLFVWGVGKYREGSSIKAEISSISVSKIQQNIDYAGFNDPSIESMISSSVDAVKSQGTDTFYGKTALLYSVIDNIRSNNVAAAKEALSNFTFDNFFKADSPIARVNLDQQSIVDELAALLSVRVDILDGGDSTSIRKKLVSLTYSSQFVNTEALLMLYRISESKAEVDEVIDVYTKVSTVRPEVAVTAKPALEDAGLNVSSI